MSYLVTWYIDIECLPPGQNSMPTPENDSIVCVCLASGTEYISVVLDNVDFQSVNGNWYIGHFSSENKLLTFVSQFLSDHSPDVLVGWNLPFDIEYLQKRCEILGIQLDLSGSCQLDLLASYRNLYRKKSYRLKDIAVEEKLVSEPEPVVDYKELWETDIPALLQRNYNHTEWCYQIDKKHNIVEYQWHLKEMVGLEDLKDIFYTSTLTDTALLRRTECVLPSKSTHQRESFEGAYVMPPPTGVFRGVAMYDLSRFYPSIIMAERLDPLIIAQYRKQNGQTIDWITYKEFSKGKPSLLLSYLEELIQERIRLQREYPDRVASVKALLNSVYGVFASPHFRLYTPEIPERVTEVARTTIKMIISTVESWKYRVLYSDTDSLCVEVSREDADNLTSRINEYLGEDYSIKLEHYFTSILFTGRKKRYAGLEEDGALHLTGFEWKRSDSSTVTKSLQEELFGLILNEKKDSIISYLRSKIEQVKTAPLRDLAVTKTLARDLSGYSKQKQDYLRSIEKSPWLSVKAGDAVQIVSAKNFPYGVAVYQDESQLPYAVEVDLEAITQKQIRAKSEDILPLVNLSWDEVLGHRRLL